MALKQRFASVLAVDAHTIASCVFLRGGEGRKWVSSEVVVGQVKQEMVTSGLHGMNLKLFEANCISDTLDNYGAVFDVSEK